MTILAVAEKIVRYRHVRDIQSINVYERRQDEVWGILTLGRRSEDGEVRRPMSSS
jgi:hypothetical protein